MVIYTINMLIPTIDLVKLEVDSMDHIGFILYIFMVHSGLS